MNFGFNNIISDISRFSAFFEPRAVEKLFDVVYELGQSCLCQNTRTEENEERIVNLENEELIVNPFVILLPELQATIVGFLNEEAIYSLALTSNQMFTQIITLVNQNARLKLQNFLKQISNVPVKSIISLEQHLTLVPNTFPDHKEKIKNLKQDLRTKLSEMDDLRPKNSSLITSPSFDENLLINLPLYRETTAAMEIKDRDIQAEKLIEIAVKFMCIGEFEQARNIFKKRLLAWSPLKQKEALESIRICLEQSGDDYEKLDLIRFYCALTNCNDMHIEFFNSLAEKGDIKSLLKFIRVHDVWYHEDSVLQEVILNMQRKEGIEETLELAIALAQSGGPIEPLQNSLAAFEISRGNFHRVSEIYSLPGVREALDWNL